MANQLTKDLEIMFEEYVTGFEAANVASREVKKFRPDDTAMQRAGDVFFRPQQYHMEVVEGLDLTAYDGTQLVQRMVPTALKQPQNILYKLDAREMRDPEHKKEAGRAAAQRLSAKIDSDLADAVAARATNVVTTPVSSTNKGEDIWDAAATMDALLLSIGVPLGVGRKAFFNPFDYKEIAKTLGNRSFSSNVEQTAWEKARIPGIASFDSFRTDYNGTLAAATPTALTLAAAPAHKVTAMDINGTPTDNRQDTITVSAAGLKVGDAFTIAGVNSVHMIKKTDTGRLQTFRVLAVSGNTATISPKILPPNNADVASRPYSNVTANAANGAAITLLNTRGGPVDAFWTDGAVELIYGKLAFPSGQGPQVMTARTEQGATLIMSYGFNHISGVTTTRFTTLYGCNVLVPEMTGILLANQ